MAEQGMIDVRLVNAIQIAVNFPSINRIGVFGSHARGEATYESDFDILYDYDENQVDDMLSCLEAIDSRLGHLGAKIDFVSIYSLYEGEKDAYDIAFRDNVLREVVWVYERGKTSACAT